LKGSANMEKTIIVAVIAAIVVIAVFRKIYKDYKKNKNFCGTDCCSCSGVSVCNLQKKSENHNK